MPTSLLTHLQCASCGRDHDAGLPQNLCACGGPLLARYDLDRGAGEVGPAALAGAVIAAAVAAGGWFDAGTLREPYRIEGKKTIGLELLEQFGWSPPDVIVCPTGGGVGLIGIDKALTEACRLGWVHGPQ